MSSLPSSCRGLYWTAQEAPQKGYSRLLTKSNSLPTLSAARKRKGLPASMTGERLVSHFWQAWATSGSVTQQTSSSTQLVRKSRTSTFRMRQQSASRCSSPTLGFGRMSLHIPTAHLTPSPLVFTSSKSTRQLPSAAHSQSHTYRQLFRQFTTSSPPRPTTAAALYSTCFPPSSANQMYPKQTQACVRRARARAKANSGPWPQGVARGRAAEGSWKLQPVKDISGKRMRSRAEVLSYWERRRAACARLWALSARRGLFWQSTAFSLRGVDCMGKRFKICDGSCAD